MKTERVSLLIVASLFISLSLFARTWHKDVLGEKFVCTTIQLPNDYSGAVKATAIKYDTLSNTSKGVLYIHGFNDYFFQKEEAKMFSKHGYRFYALDLRKYGRSYLNGQRMGEVKDLSEYYTEMDSCFAIMKSEGIQEIILVAHSTGGLISTNYAVDHKNHLPFSAMILNSPFLDWNFGSVKEAIGTPLASMMGKIASSWEVNSGDNSFYGESMHKNYVGAWDYNLAWKPAETIPVNLAWVRAIHTGQKKIQHHPEIPCPILVMHSDKSGYGNKWSDDFFISDIILDVKDIEKYGKQLGPHSSTVSIKNGVHDLVLSKPEIRAEVYKTMFSWLEKLKL